MTLERRALRGGRRLRGPRRLRERVRRERLAPVPRGAPVLGRQRLALGLEGEVVQRARHGAAPGHQQRELQLRALRLRFRGSRV